MVLLQPVATWSLLARRAEAEAKVAERTESETAAA
jgi:hypothetical protein